MGFENGRTASERVLFYARRLKWSVNQIKVGYLILTLEAPYRQVGTYQDGFSVSTWMKREHSDKRTNEVSPCTQHLATEAQQSRRTTGADRALHVPS